MEAVMLSPDHPLAAGLAANRERFNSLFLHARHANPQLDPKRFLAHLKKYVAPVLEAVCMLARSERDPALEALYQLSIEIEATNATPQYRALWTKLLSGLAWPLSQGPAQVGAALSNALHTLANHPGARAEEWVIHMLSLNAGNPPVEALLAAGQVAAWRAGLPHYRREALRICRTLQPEWLVRNALGMRIEQAPIPVISTLMALEVDPWLLPSSFPVKGTKTLRLANAVGGFSGYEGLFNRPPRVFASDQQIYAQDGERYWAVMADAFGASCYPCPKPPPELPGVKATRHAISANGDILFGGLEGTFPVLSGVSSSAANPNTLAVVRGLSFRIYLIAASEAA